jgi:hypothetical protein
VISPKAQKAVEAYRIKGFVGVSCSKLDHLLLKLATLNISDWINRIDRI